MRIIAVDDEPFALTDLCETIEAAVKDASVLGFSTPQKAIDYAAGQPVDVSFLDIELPGMNGLELAKRLKKEHGAMNIVFVTGYSQYAVDAFSLYASGYLLKPVTADAVQAAMEHLRHPVLRPEQGLRVQTFGNFEVFMDGVPVRFPRSKSKELFAYLIHKRGTGCTTKEIAAVLFEERPYTPSLQKQIQTVISGMVQALKSCGAGDCIVKSYNQMAVNPDKVNCDYYQFLTWDPHAINSYTGEYMSNYSWAEFVIGYLDSKRL